MAIFELLDYIVKHHEVNDTTELKNMFKGYLKKLYDHVGREYRPEETQLFYDIYGHNFMNFRPVPG